MRIVDIDYNEKLKLVEGVQYGQKQSSWVLSNLDKFRIGLEAELSYKEMDSGDLSNMDSRDLADRYNFDNSLSINDLVERYDGDADEIKRSVVDVIATNMDEHEVIIARDGDALNPIIRLLNSEDACRMVLDNQSDVEYGTLKIVMELIYGGSGYSSLEETIKPIYDFSEDYSTYDILDKVLNGKYTVDIQILINELDSLNESLNEHVVVNDDGKLLDETEIDDDAMSEIINYATDLFDSLELLCRFREDYLNLYKGSFRDALFNAINNGDNFDDYLEPLLDMAGMDTTEFVDDVIGDLPSGYNAEPHHFYDVDDSSGEDNSDAYIEQVQEIIDASGYSSSFKVIPEGGKMIEIITKGEITGDEIEEIYDELFNIIKQLKIQGFTTRDSQDDEQGTGMHISISMPSYKGMVDPVKFLLLSNIMELLPEDSRYIRKYVNDIRENFKDRRSLEILVGSLFSNKFKNNESLSKDYAMILKEWSKLSIEKDVKFQSVNFQHMDTQSGRIEIRMFGGENFDYMKDLMWEETIRSMYALYLASSDTEGDREYLQILNKMANEVIHEIVGMDVSEYFVTLKKIYGMFNSVFPDFQKAIDLATASQYMMMDMNKYPHLMRSLGGAENKIPQYLEQELRSLGASEIDMAVTDLIRQRFDEFFPKAKGYMYKPDVKKVKDMITVLKKTVNDLS